MKHLLCIMAFLWMSPDLFASDIRAHIALELLKDGNCDPHLLQKSAQLLEDEISYSSTGNGASFPESLTVGCQFAKYPYGMCENRSSIQKLGASTDDDLEQYFAEQLLGKQMTKEQLKKN